MTHQRSIVNKKMIIKATMSAIPGYFTEQKIVPQKIVLDSEINE